MFKLGYICTISDREPKSLRWYYDNCILLIRDMGLDVEIVSITTKPYILQKILEFDANVLCDNMGSKRIQPQTSKKAVRGQKHL